MGFESDYRHTPYVLDDKTLAQQHFSQNQKLTEKALASLPSNRELLNKIKAYGLNRL